MSRLKEMYKNEIMDAMTKKFGYKNVMEVPKLDKIVINMGVGEAKENAKLLDAAIADMELIRTIESQSRRGLSNPRKCLQPFSEEEACRRQKKEMRREAKGKELNRRWMF